MGRFFKFISNSSSDFGLLGILDQLRLSDVIHGRFIVDLSPARNRKGQRAKAHDFPLIFDACGESVGKMFIGQFWGEWENRRKAYATISLLASWDKKLGARSKNKGVWDWGSRELATWKYYSFPLSPISRTLLRYISGREKEKKKEGRAGGTELLRRGSRVWESCRTALDAGARYCSSSSTFHVLVSAPRKILHRVRHFLAVLVTLAAIRSIPWISVNLPKGTAATIFQTPLSLSLNPRFLQGMAILFSA